MSAAVDLVPMTPRHLVPPDLHRVEALLVQMSADIGRLAAKVETLGDGQKDIRAEMRELRADLSSLAANYAGNRASDLKAAEDQRAADGPALSWAKWQRGAVFWIMIAAAGVLMTWGGTKWLDSAWNWAAR